MSLDDQLAELWAAGATLTEIGLQMGVSRSVVAGRLARARARRTDDPRLAPRPRPPKVMPAPRVRSVKPGHEVIGNAPPPVPPRPRLLVDLGPRDCRWAVGEAADGRHLMCGRPQVAGRPYCATHAVRTAGASGTGAKFVLRAVATRIR